MRPYQLSRLEAALFGLAAVGLCTLGAAALGIFGSSDNLQWWECDLGGFMPTHWMPLPPPPSST